MMLRGGTKTRTKIWPFFTNVVAEKVDGSLLLEFGNWNAMTNE